MTTLTKNNKIELAQEKSQEFNSIVKKNLASIKYKTQYYFPYSKEDREELLQNTLVKAYLAFPSFDPSRGAFIAWISFIMKSEMIDDYRKNNKKNSVTDSIDKENEYEHSISYTICGNDFERLEKNIELEEVYLQKISKLSDSHKEIFKMFIDGYKIREISNILNIPEGTIKNKIFLIRNIINGSAKRI